MWTSQAEQRQLEQLVYTDDYAGYRPDPIFEESIGSLLDNEIVPRLPSRARILDVGCGAGVFMEAAKRRGLQPFGVDISDAAARYCQGKGLQSSAGDFVTMDLGGEYDAVTMWDVVEHLRDPGAFFQRAGQVLREGGLLVGKVPAFGAVSVGVSNRIPRLAGILLGAPDHVQYFTRNSLSALMRRTGFEAEWLHPRVNRMRAKPQGGSLKRRTGRLVASSIKAVSGDANIYFIARLAAHGGEGTATG